MSVSSAPLDDADVCVIGAGPAGAILADRLAESHRVVVLDAGPRFDSSERLRRMERSIRPGFDEPDVWDMDDERDAYSSSGEWFYPLNHTRVKGIGGSSLHWQGMVMRLHESDFECRSRYGVGVDWPFSYSDLQPYYAESEKEMGVSGAMDNPFSPPRQTDYPLPGFEASYSDDLFMDACESLDIVVHSAPNARNSVPYRDRGECVGYGTCQPVCPSGAKYSADIHIDSAKEKGAKIISNADVTNLEHESDRVVYAEYVVDEVHRQEADFFVVACGGVETPRLLLMSKSDEYPEGLGNSSGLVGRFFMDHLFAGMGGLYKGDTRQNHVGFNTSESHQFYDEASDETAPFKLEFFNYAGPSPVETALRSDTWGDDLLELLRSEYGNHVGIGALVEQLPRHDSYVGLDEERTDHLGNPVPEIHWNVGERALRTIDVVNEVQRGILDEMGVDVTWTVDRESTGPAYHHMGTTRMGVNPVESVVDPDLKLHDVDNCWVVSSSVFPTGGAMNPTLTIGALSLRAADSVENHL